MFSVVLVLDLGNGGSSREDREQEKSLHVVIVIRQTLVGKGLTPNSGRTRV
jgi:hypothetical protein